MKFFALATQAIAVVSASNCIGPNNDTQAPCVPGHEWCGQPFTNAPVFHLMDQHGCGENDPNGPVFDPVHGVIHHFYQIHLAAVPGHGPDYGHFVSKDFVNWAPMPVAIWNGIDNSVDPPAVTPYDNEAIFTGSAVVVDGAGPGGKGKGIVNIYPGLCNKHDWKNCGTGTLLAQAVPADYENDELLEKWKKPSYNPIMEDTQRDPATPWKTSHGEYRLRTYNSIVYGAASAEDMLAGKWYEIGTSKDFRQCECPSFYPLPAATPGFEAEYEAAAAAGALPTHVHKTSCGGDWWQMGTYVEGAPKQLGSFTATAGWEDLFDQKRIDEGKFYASKDNEYPTLSGGTRRINWGWAQVPPASTQTLPREITFNAAARTLQQYPIEEIEKLRTGSIAEHRGAVSGTVKLNVAAGEAKQSEIVATIGVPTKAAKISVTVGSGSGTPVGRYMEKTDMPGDDYSIVHHPKDTPASVCQKSCDDDSKCQSWTYVIRGADGGGDCCKKDHVPCPVTTKPIDSQCTSGAKSATSVPGCGGGQADTTSCTIDFQPNTNASAPFYEVPVTCGTVKDTLRLLPSEKTIEVRLFNDYTFIEAFFQKGRIAMTVSSAMNNQTGLYLTANDAVNVDASAYSLRSIWVDSEDVRKAKRVYN